MALFMSRSSDVGVFRCTLNVKNFFLTLNEKGVSTESVQPNHKYGLVVCGKSSLKKISSNFELCFTNSTDNKIKIVSAEIVTLI